MWLRVLMLPCIFPRRYKYSSPYNDTLHVESHGTLREGFQLLLDLQYGIYHGSHSKAINSREHGKRNPGSTKEVFSRAFLGAISLPEHEETPERAEWVEFQ